MLKVVIFLLFIKSSFVWAESRTKVYNDSLIRVFDISCGEWTEWKNFSGDSDVRKRCYLKSMKDKSWIDSIAYKSGFYELREMIYDATGKKVLYIVKDANGDYDMDRFESGRLIAREQRLFGGGGFARRICLG